MTQRFVRVAIGTVTLASMVVVVVAGHITPEVVVRKQSDVIRSAIPGATTYHVTTVDISRPQLERIVAQAHYQPTARSVRFFSGEDSGGRRVGTVVFPQVDTQHGPIEVGVAIDPDGAVTGVTVTKITVEMKPWWLDVDRSHVLERLNGLRAGDKPPSLSGNLGAMPGYVADAIATATVRGLTLYQTLAP